jgi:acetyltransferase-like isoleucine patch superfamily enzyme
MIKYILGFLCHIFNFRVSKFALIDNISILHKRAKVNYGCQIFNSKIGAYTYIGPNSSIVCAEIGKFCSVAKDVSVGLAKHDMDLISTSPIFTSKANGTGSVWTTNNDLEECARVVIGNDVWIGTKVIIMGGVRVGDGSVIGAGSIVTKDIPDYAIAVGAPAKIIKYRFEPDIIEKLQKIKWWNLSESKLRGSIRVFQDKNISINKIDDIF